MNTQPFVSVLMPVYNAGEFLHKSIKSVLQQTYSLYEFLIINDGSTDNSREIILSYEDKRIRYIEKEGNSGLIATLNEGLDFVTGKYVVRMDADDICKPTRIERQVEFMESHPEVGISGCCADVIGKAIKMNYDADDTSIRIKMLYQCHLLHPSMIIRKDLIDKYGWRYNPEYVHAEDYELFYRVSKVTRLGNLTERLLLYREHEKSVSRKYSQIQKENSLKVIQHQFRDIGLDVTEEEVDLFKGLMYSRFDFSQEQLLKAEEFLFRFLEANEQTKKLNKKTLIRIIIQKWKDMLLNAANPGMNNYGFAMNSTLLKYGSYSFAEKIKLRMKSLLNS